jgi:hypothetical protein
VNLIIQSPGSPLAEDVDLPRADAILRRGRSRRRDDRHFLRAASVVLDTSGNSPPSPMEGDTKTP